MSAKQSIGSPEIKDPPTVPEDLLEQGKALQRAGTPFVTAISVQKPRDLDKIVAAMDKEAEYAGEAFWYSWTQKGKRIEGATIGLANSLAREWGNSAVTVALDENDEAFYITPRFIDLEKGSQMERVYRQRKTGQVQGNYESDRALDITLQIGQSKAIRNVVVNSVPRWLVDRTIKKAKKAAAEGIDASKLDEISLQVVSYFKSKGVTEEQLVEKAGRPIAEWVTMTIADFRADKAALDSGEVTINDLFPKGEPKDPDGPVDVTEALKGKPEKTPPADPGKIGPEEAAEIAKQEKAEASGKKPPAKKKDEKPKGKSENLFA